MKKLVFCFVFALSLGACAPSRYWVFNSEGIATYDRHSGRFEILWQNNTAPVTVIHDTIYLSPGDSAAQKYAWPIHD